MSVAARARDWVARHPTLVALVFYLAIVGLWDHKMVLHPNTYCACNLPGDSSMFVWSFVWYPHALLHGLPLFTPHNVFAPGGLNLAATTTAPIVAFAMAPVTYLFGPVVTYGVVTFAAPVVNSLCAYLLCRYISKAPWASIVAGATYGFGAYMIPHLGGHLTLFIAFYPPLIVLCTLKLLAGELRPRWFVALVGVMGIVQIGISTEIFFTSTALGAVALAGGYLLGDRPLRRRILGAVGWLLLADVIAVIVSAYYLYWELKGPAAAVNAGLVYPTDLLAYIIPMNYEWIGGTRFAGVSAIFGKAGAEVNAYLGIVLILIVVRYISTHWSSARTRLMTLLLAVSVLWVLGTRLYVAGVSTIWLPYSIFAHLPIFNQVMQGRVALYTALIAAVIMALWVGRTGSHKRLRWVVGVLALAMVLPNLLHPSINNNGRWENPEFFKTNMYQRYIPTGSRIVVMRWWADANFSMLWQTEDHFDYTLADGSFGTIPVAWLHTPIEFDLFNNTPQKGDGPRYRRWLIDHGVDYVVVEPQWEALWGPTLHAAGLHQRIHAGGIYLYPVPRSWLRSDVT